MTTEKWTPTYTPPALPVPPDQLEKALNQYAYALTSTLASLIKVSITDLSNPAILDKEKARIVEEKKQEITEGMIEWLKEVWLPKQLAESNRVYAIMFKFPGEWRCRVVVNEDATRPRIYTTLAAASKEKQRMQKLHSDVTYYVVEVEVQQ